MKKILFVLVTLNVFVLGLIAQESTAKTNLVFVAEFPSFENWLNKAFNTDATRRAGYCDETMTKFGKVNEQMALVYLHQFDMTRMAEFASNEKMAALMVENKVNHSAVYQVVEMDPEAAPSTADLLFVINFNDFDGWSKNAFEPDSARRAKFSDESRTKMAKIDDNHAMVILYNVDLTRIWEFETNPEVQKLMQQYEVSHRVSLLKAL